jgi:two-component system nitrogen regulation response regulator GlnG
MNPRKALIADDDESILWVLERFLGEKGIETVRALSGTDAERVMESSGAGIAVMDINMPGKDGLEVLRGMKDGAKAMPVIIMTAETTLKNALEAMRLGAFDYINKPFDLDELGLMVERAFENARLLAMVAHMSERLKESSRRETAFIGGSRAAQGAFKTAGKVAGKDVTVLILGESGTGKELLARLIHAASPRSDGPFVAMNSAAVPRELMESELLGFEKGAFTGAVEAKKGKFELADGGTIFLDEVGDMAPDLQARLLRVIQEKEFYRVGGKEPVRVDVRIITATNQDLDKAVHEKRFREDLLFRLNGVAITLPPLRERKGDVALLSAHFLERFAAEFGSGARTLSKKAIEALEAYQWPGNVREIENVLRRAVLLAPGAVIAPADLNLPEAERKKESLEEMITAKLRQFIDKTDRRGRQELYDLIMPFMERPLIRLVLEKTRGNQVQAAEVLGINRNTLRKKIKELDIKLERTRD